MKQTLLAAFLGGVAAYFWGTISWTVLPWHNATIRNLPNENAIIDLMKANVRETGVYRFPSEPRGELTEEQIKAWSENYRRGPVGLIAFFKEGPDPMSPFSYVIAFFLNIGAAGFVVWPLRQTLAARPSYWQKVAFVLCFGIFATFVSYLSLLNWNFYTIGFSAVMALDLVIAWFLAGLVLAWRVKLPTDSL